MPKKFILIDCENVGFSEDINSYIVEYEIFAFVGLKQNISKPNALLGAHVHRYPNTGNNSNDFMIVYWVSRLQSIYGNQSIYIVSKDNAFKTFMENCKSIGFTHVHVVDCIKDIKITATK